MLIHRTRFRRCLCQAALGLLIAFLAAGVGVSALAADASIPRIGVLAPRSSALTPPRLREALAEFGYVEGKQILIEWRQFEGGLDQARPLADSLVRAKVQLIVTGTTPATSAAMDATSTIPVVFAVGDPVRMGFVQSLAKPGRNATGVSVLATDLTAKRMEILKQLLPAARRIFYLRNPSNPMGGILFAEAQRAAQALRVKVIPVDASNATEVASTMRSVTPARADALLVSEDLAYSDGETMRAIADAVRGNRMPALFPWPDYHRYGVLVSYGIDRGEIPRHLVAYVDKILKGATPADLPVQQLAAYQLVIDLKQAQAIGVQVPSTLRVRADKVLE